MNDFKIRFAERSDIPQLIELFREFSVFEKKPDKMHNSVERMQAEFDSFSCFVAIDMDNKIVGYLSYFFSYYTWVGKSLYMDDLYVKPEYRKNHIGRSLVQMLMGLAKSENCHKIRWQVSKWNEPAIRFYNSLGAEIDDVELDCDLSID